MTKSLVMPADSREDGRRCAPPLRRQVVGQMILMGSSPAGLHLVSLALMFSLARPDGDAVEAFPALARVSAHPVVPIVL